MSTVEQDYGIRAVSETLSDSPVNRKRSRSSDSETEDALTVKKKPLLLNGEIADGVSLKDTPATMEEKEQPVQERVVILDAGAQYGKVPKLLSGLFDLAHLDTKYIATSNSMLLG
jgi:hypothetical protein